MRIAHRIFEEDLLDNARLPCAWFLPMTIRADRVHLDLARGIASEHRAVLNQHGARAVSGRRNRGAYSRKAAAGDQEIGFDLLRGQERHDGEQPLELVGQVCELPWS